MKRTIAMVGFCAVLVGVIGCPLFQNPTGNGNGDQGANVNDNGSQGGGENENLNDSESTNDNDNQSANENANQSANENANQSANENANQSANENENLNDSENLNDNDNAPATVSVTAMGTWTLADGDLANIRAGMVYVNLHTMANPPGEIRGQVSAGGDANTFVATLNGDQEVPAVTTDATGTATLTLNADETEITFDISGTGLSGSITGSHFHVGAIGEAGPIIFDFTDTVMEQ